jgi:anti-sigma factor RsiW
MARLNDGKDTMTDQWTDRLSEYLDGDLAPGERAALEVHLADCATCRATVDDLRRVVTRAHALVDQPVGSDLWPGIAARIGAAGTPVVDLASRRPRRRFSLSLPQLAAAAVLLIAATAGGTFLALRTGPERTPAAPDRGAITGSGARAIPAGLPDKAQVSYDAAVHDLERALDAGRSRLAPKTVLVLEKNLARIDAAIAEARAALKADPANVYLNTHLANTMQQKLELLRRAAALADVQS